MGVLAFGWQVRDMGKERSGGMPVQRLARLLDADIARLLDGRVRRADADLRQQLQRATNSVVLNVEEAASSFRPGRKSQLYRVAKGSLGECDAILRALVDRGIVSYPDTRRARGRISQLAGQLTRLIRHLSP
jgi:four helix bundle protein